MIVPSLFVSGQTHDWTKTISNVVEEVVGPKNVAMEELRDRHYDYRFQVDIMVRYISCFNSQITVLLTFI